MNIKNTRFSMKPIAAILAASMVASTAFAADKTMQQAVTDARLEGQIATAIVFNSHLNPFEISVEVDNGTAVLTGVVDESIDKDLAERVAPPKVIEKLMALGVLLYGGVGVVTMVLGGDYLDYSVLAATPAGGQHLGIFLVELGVGITVAATMVTIFFHFSGREPGE